MTFYVIHDSGNATELNNVSEKHVTEFAQLYPRVNLVAGRSVDEASVVEGS